MQYLMAHFIKSGRVRCLSQNTSWRRQDLIGRMRELAEDFQDLGMILDQDLSHAVTGYPQMTLRCSGGACSENQLILQVCDDGRET